MRPRGFVLESTLIMIAAMAFGLLVVGAMAGVAQRQHELQTTRLTASRPSQEGKGALIKNFMAQWSTLQKLIPMPPVLGSTTWNVDDLQFIGNRSLLVAFEDGHIMAAVVFKYQPAATFSYEALFKDNFPFTLEQWRAVVKQYGDAQYSVSTYTKEVVRGAEVVRFVDWTKVAENKFVKSQPVTPNTSTWQTYRNEQYGFEFEYSPESFSPRSEIFQRMPITDKVAALRVASISSLTGSFRVLTSDGYYDEKLGRNMAPEEILEFYRSLSPTVTTKDVVVDGRKATQISWPSTGGNVLFKKVYIPQANGGFIMIEWSIAKNKYDEIYEQMFSTFKFIEPNTSSTSTSEMQIASPAGGEQWMVGKTYNIRWVGYENYPASTVGIELISGSGSPCPPNSGMPCQASPSYTIADHAPNTGSYQWTVPLNFPLGLSGEQWSRAFVRLWVNGQDQGEYVGKVVRSQELSIVLPPLGPIPGPY